MVTEERFYVGSRRSLMAEVWPATLFTSKYSPLLFSKGRFFKRAREEEGERGREKNRQRTKRKKTRGGSECLAVCRIWVSDLGPWRLVAWSAGNLFSRPSPPSISLSLPPSSPLPHEPSSPSTVLRALCGQGAHRKRLKTVQAGRGAFRAIVV